MSTTVKPNTTQQILDGKTPDQVGLGVTVLEEDTGTITASATVKTKYPALAILSARVATSGTAGSVGSYLVSDSAATVSTPTAASAQAGVAKVATDRQTVTFPNTVTRVIFQYIPLIPAPIPAVAAAPG